MDTKVVTIISGDGEIEIFSVFASCTTECGSAAVTEAACTNPLVRSWWVASLPPLTKMAVQQMNKSQFPQLIRM